MAGDLLIDGEMEDLEDIFSLDVGSAVSGLMEAN